MTRENILKLLNKSEDEKEETTRINLDANDDGDFDFVKEISDYESSVVNSLNQFSQNKIQSVHNYL